MLGDWKFGAYIVLAVAQLTMSMITFGWTVAGGMLVFAAMVLGAVGRLEGQ